MAVVTHRRAWGAALIALALALLTGYLLPRSASASAGASTSASVSASTASYTGGVTNVTTVYSDTVSHGDGTRVPDIVGTGGNNAIVVWREGILPGHVDQGYFRYARTTDGGVNWDGPRTLAQENSAYTWNSVILFYTDGQVFAFLGRSVAKESQTGGASESVVVKRSTDGGDSWKTWGTNINDLGIEKLALSGHPLKMGSKYVMPYWASGRENGVLISDDLSHWTKGGTIDGNTATTLAGENQIAVSQDNENDLVMVARAANPSHTAAIATSHDGGASWCNPADNPNGCVFSEAAGMPSYDIARGVFVKDLNEQYLYIYNSGTSKADHDQLAYKVKPRGGVWSAAAPFVDTDDEPAQPDGNGADWDTYPMATEYAPGKFLVVWESDTMHIDVGRLDVSATG